MTIPSLSTSPAPQSGGPSFRGNPKDLYTAGIMKEIVNRFPETPFVIGDGYDREYVKGDFRERLVKHTLDVGVDNPEAFARLSAVPRQHIKN